jgi:DNA-binding PadR family transcriptional regulator
MTSEKYNELVQRFQSFQSIHAKIDDYELDILELFAQTESLTTTEVTDIIKSTKIEMTQKNVYYKIRNLKSLNLIEEATVDKKRRRHNEKYFKLTDEGIYQLFLKMRYHGILLDQTLIKKSGIIISRVNTFFRYYGNNVIFELFLYPYFERQTISTDNFDLLVKLFRYLHDCCKEVESAIRIHSPIPQFVWNKVPGEYSKEILKSLKKIFTLDDTDNAHIQRTPDNSAITVTTLRVHIVIKLDLTRGKATATANVDNYVRTYEYEILNFGPDIIACSTQSSEELLKRTLDSRRLIEAPIYELVSNVGKRGSETQIEVDSLKVLAQDTKFMSLLEDIHSNFERGYKPLMELRIRL